MLLIVGFWYGWKNYRYADEHLQRVSGVTELGAGPSTPGQSQAPDIDGTAQLALTKAVQVDPVRRVLEHVDFVAVKRGEKVTVDVPVVVVGEAAAETLVVTENATVQVEAEAPHIPEQFEVDVTDAEAGTQFLAGALALPSGTTLLTDAETLVVNVTAAVAAEEPAEGEAAEGEGAEAPAEAEATEGGDSE